jgi:crossover junction endodeoxyribonuclease RuvC
MRIIGIDPGSAVTGYGIVELADGVIRHLDNGGISPRPNLPYPQRLHYIYTALTQLIEDHRLDAAVIEKVFVAKNARSSLLLGQARGVAMLAATSAGLKMAEYTPAEVKMAVVGTGRATKHQVQCMVKTILGLNEVAQEDASDALAVAICHCHSAGLKERIEESLRNQEVGSRK